MPTTAAQKEILRLFHEGISKTEIARRTGAARSTVIRCCRDVVPTDTAEQERRITNLATEKELLKAVKGERSFRNFLGDMLREIAEPWIPPPIPKLAAKNKRHERFPLLHLSDWHFEETVRRDSVLGLNEYSIPIACRRVYRVIQAVRHWHRTYAASFVVPELVVSLNGDFLTGTLHGLERHSAARNVVQATLECGKLIALALRDLAAEFPKLRIVGTVGNHGRLPDDRKPPTKDPTRSWDYIAYRYAQALLSECKNIEWTLPDSYGVLFETGGHLCFQGHGHDLKQQLGIVGYSMRRFGANLAANLSETGRRLRYLFFGHFHSANSAEFGGVECFIGPSLIGTQEYEFLSSGASNRAAQHLHVMDATLGAVSRDTLYGDGPGYDGAYSLAA